MRLAVHLAKAAAIAGAVYPFLAQDNRRHKLQRWSAQMVTVMGARLTVRGTPPVHNGAPFMIVANHVSWLDIFAINAAVPMRFVAKSEVRAWPLIGWLCARADTLFIERGRRRDLARIDDEIAAALRAGGGMGIFLEGTTTDGSVVLPFHSSLLRPAQLADAVIYPVAIRYCHADGALCSEPAYDGDKTLWDTLKAMSTLREFQVHVHFLPPMAVAGVHRRELAQRAHAAVSRVLYP